MSASAKPRPDLLLDEDPEPEDEVDAAFDEWSLDDMGLRADLAALQPQWSAAYD